MADTNAHHADQIPVEGDGVSYSGIVWFVVILTVTTVFCQLLVWGLFEYMQSREFERDPARSIVAAPTGTLPPTPNLLTDEPARFDRALGSLDGGFDIAPAGSPYTPGPLLIDRIS